MKSRGTRSDSCKPVNLGDHPGRLRIAAFSDYRAQDIEIVVNEIAKIRPRPDLVFYAGDDISRFRRRGKNFFEIIASHSRYGLCAVAGNDDDPSTRRLISGKSVFDVHFRPVILGQYAILGVDGAPRRSDLEGIGYLLHTEGEIKRHLVSQAGVVGPRRLLMLSHAPPDGVLDQAIRFSLNREPRSIGSRAVKNFVVTNKETALVVCGHVHRCGGQDHKLANAVVVNAANHDDFEAVAHLAVIDLAPKHTTVKWRVLKPISSVPGIGPAYAERLIKRGIRTVEQLAACNIDKIRRAVPYAELVSVRARAIAENRPFLFRQPSPKPKGVEVFLDIETDLRQEYVWLVGLCIGRKGKYRKFFAKSRKDELRVLSNLLAFMQAHPNARIVTCSGSRFEERIMRKRLLAHDLPADICNRMEDVHQSISHSVALPTSSYKVKDMGKFWGYRYKHPELDGFAVAQLYEGRYRRSRNLVQRRKLAKKLIEYNEDDVRCLPFILDAIERMSRDADEIAHIF